MRLLCTTLLAALPEGSSLAALKEAIGTVPMVTKELLSTKAHRKALSKAEEERREAGRGGGASGGASGGGAGEGKGKKKGAGARGKVVSQVLRRWANFATDLDAKMRGENDLELVGIRAPPVVSGRVVDPPPPSAAGDDSDDDEPPLPRSLEGWNSYAQAAPVSRPESGGMSGKDRLGAAARAASADPTSRGRRGGAAAAYGLTHPLDDPMGGHPDYEGDRGDYTDFVGRMGGGGD